MIAARTAPHVTRRAVWPTIDAALWLRRGNDMTKDELIAYARERYGTEKDSSGWL